MVQDVVRYDVARGVLATNGVQSKLISGVEQFQVNHHIFSEPESPTAPYRLIFPSE